jgi:hypothetical protein
LSIDNLTASALTARTISDVDRLEAEIVKRVGGEWPRNLGDNEANWSVIASGVDPRTVIFERVTNMWDALIEAEAQRRQDFACTSPAEAARKFLGVPRGGPSELVNAERERIAALSTLSFLDSDDSSRQPSVAARDFGIGVTPVEMPETILSLQRSNKLHKPYLHGVFGKGGSIACLFSKATIIVTRKQPDLLDGAEDRVAVAIVREADAPDVRLPFFRYLTGPDSLPYSVPSSEADFEPGTYVVHIGYQAEKMGQQTWQLEESVYAFAETLLFRPTLPYRLEDGRSAAHNRRPEGRRKPTVVMGLGQRLAALKPADGLLDSSRPARISIPNVGDVGLRWWLFDDEDKRRRRLAKGYATLFTTGGQVHRYWDTSRFKLLVDGRGRVARRIVVEVDTDSIDPKKRVRIFSSFRDVFLKSPEAAALERAVAEWLAADPDLEEAESRFTREALRSAGRGVSAALRQRLNRAIRGRNRGLSGAGPGTTPGPRPPKPKPEDELYPEPTEFVGPENVQIQPGQRRIVYVRCNAHDGFIPDTGEIEVEATPGLDVSYGVGDLRRGRLQLSLQVPEDAALGEYELDVTLSWMRAAGGAATLHWPIKLELVSELAPAQPRGGQPRRPASRGDFAFLWSDHETQEGWDDEVVGELQYIKGDELAAAHKEYRALKGDDTLVPTVVLNSRFRDFAAYLRGIVSRGASDEARELREDRYAIAVGVAVANLHLREEKLKKAYAAYEQAANGREEPERALTDAQMRRALAEHARGVLTLLPEFDQLLGDVEDREAVAVA